MLMPIMGLDIINSSYVYSLYYGIVTYMIGTSASRSGYTIVLSKINLFLLFS